MPATKQQLLSGWGNFPSADCPAYRPEKRRELATILREHAGHILARGMGRSYGDASLQPEGVISTVRLDHVVAFDTATGLLTAQAGLTLAELMDIAIPKGWFPPVIPGTRFVTLGGAFACNVHGKNHYAKGDFAEHVTAIRLTLADGSSHVCSPQQNAELFWATAGGMGMTGIIEEVSIQLQPIASASLKSTTYSVDNIEEMLSGFEKYRGTADYMLGWIDHMAKGHELGRGIFSAASHISEAEGGAPVASFSPTRPKLNVPLFAPSFLLNRYVMALYNRMRFSRYSRIPRDEIVDFNGFFHPLDGIGSWNKLYGKRGFFQYQCVLPESPEVGAQLRDLLDHLQSRGLFSFLGVIKYHRTSVGPLTFPLQGYSLALDFPNSEAMRQQLHALDHKVESLGGRIYLAKDALLTPDLFAAMYKEAQNWLNIVAHFDPAARFTSLMSERLQWKKR